MVASQAQLIAAVRSRLDRIGRLDGAEVLSLSAGELSGQNQYSSRAGTCVTIEFAKDAAVATLSLWAKRVESPADAYEAMRTVYERAASAGLAAAIPEPYFYDVDLGLIFMAKRTGDNLLKRTLRYAFIGNPRPGGEIPELFSSLGRWLGELHDAARYAQSSSLEPVIERLLAELAPSSSFTDEEKRRLSDSLESVLATSLAKQAFALTRPHNDFTLRNLFLGRDGSFFVIDWDAMVHPDFPQRSLGWWDLCALVINLESLCKAAPAVKSSRLRTLCRAVAQGYCSSLEDAAPVSVDDFMRHILFVYTLKYWLAIDSDRSLAEIYAKGLGTRFTRRIRHGLLGGSAAILEASR